MWFRASSLTKKPGSILLNKMSKQRPSSRTTDWPGTASSPALLHPKGSAWTTRVFRNTYTRAGERLKVKGWSVKIQHQGTRRTFSLLAKARDAAAIEAQALHQSVRSLGWDSAILHHRANWARALAHNPDVEVAPKTDVRYWKRRLIRRGNLATAGGPLGAEFSTRIEHAGVGEYVPLGTSDEDLAAARALEIYRDVVRQGWDAVHSRFAREVTIAVHWSDNPLAWTYATFCTSPGASNQSTVPATRDDACISVGIVEPDSDVRWALARCVDRQSGFSASGVFGRAIDALAQLARRPVQFVLVNQSRIELPAHEFSNQLRRSVTGTHVLAYSTFEDSDQLFKATPGGASGYLLKRTPADRLFDPVAGASAQDRLSPAMIAGRVQRYFQNVVLLLSRAELSGDIPKLTHREHEILNLLSRGSVDKEIADALGISIWTVHGHLKRIYEKLGVHTRTEAAIRYLHK
jgi:DNA-binding NarL/FixJ family response regulator